LQKEKGILDSFSSLRKKVRIVLQLLFFKKAIFRVLVSSAFPSLSHCISNQTECGRAGFLWVTFLLTAQKKGNIGFKLLFSLKSNKLVSFPTATFCIMALALPVPLLIFFYYKSKLTLYIPLDIFFVLFYTLSIYSKYKKELTWKRM